MKKPRLCGIAGGGTSWRRKMFLYKGWKMFLYNGSICVGTGKDGGCPFKKVSPWIFTPMPKEDARLFTVFFAAANPEEFIIEAGLEGFAAGEAGKFARGLIQKITNIPGGWLLPEEVLAVDEIQRMALGVAAADAANGTSTRKEKENSPR